MKVQTAKRIMQLQAWASQVNARNASGQTVKQWCTENNVNLKTYYNRLNRVREELIETLEPNQPLQIPMPPSIKPAGGVSHSIPVFAAVTVPRPESPSVTVRMGGYEVEIKNNADMSIVEQVLQAVSRL